MGVTKLRLAPNNTAKTNGSSGMPRRCAIPIAMGVPMTAAALLDTTLVRIAIINIRPIMTAGAGAPKVIETTALASDMHRSGRWRHVFTSEQINAWLTLELAVNYPGLLSGEWHDPRIEIDERKATIACRYENGSISTVMSGCPTCRSNK